MYLMGHNQLTISLLAYSTRVIISLYLKVYNGYQQMTKNISGKRLKLPS
jgi:hypothetical protein